MEQIRVLLIKGEKNWPEGLSVYLKWNPDMKVVGETDDATMAVQIVKNEQVNVVLMGMLLTDSTRIYQITKEITSLTKAKVVLVGYSEMKVVYEAFMAGAVDYVADSALNQIADAIRAASLGRSPIRHEIAGFMREEIYRLRKLEQDYQREKLRSQLTPTEIQVLYYIASGHTQTEIAELMSIAVKTVKNHVSNILKKTGEKSSKQVALKALKLNILTSTEKNRQYQL